ncbi:MAG TPA: hypothetical protein VGT05_03320 [Patescibacteria group bacterium]|nr:hypothetical protein [Patescibacteria group bacterium]
MPTGVTINLVKGRGESVIDRFIAWAITLGRVVIILTEGFALAAFVYRFSLDQTLVNLHTNISQEQSILVLLHDKEGQYRNLQDRLTLSKQIITQANEEAKTFDNFISYIPANVTVNNITFASNTVVYDLSASSSDSLLVLVNKLKGNPLVSAVSVDKIDDKTKTATISITITATLKPGKGVLL